MKMLSAVVFSLLPVVASASLIENGDFENGLNGWSTTNAIGGGVDLVTEANGNHYARISDPSSFGFEWLAQDFYIPQNVDTINVTFRYNFDVIEDRSFFDDLATSTLLTVQSNVFNAIELLTSSFSSNGDTGWVTFAGEYDVSQVWNTDPNAILKFGITETWGGLFRDKTDSAFYIDDVSVVASSVPEPGSLMLMALGLAGLGFARKNQKS